MQKTINYFLLLCVISFCISCTKTNELLEDKLSKEKNENIKSNISLTNEKNVKSEKVFISSKDKYSKSLEKFKKQYSFGKTNNVNQRTGTVTEEIDAGENNILYNFGPIVGDPFDDVNAADGPIIQAVSTQEEEQTRIAISGLIINAKEYLNSNGLDFSDEFSNDDPRYIHAANIVIQMENTVGFPNNSNLISTARENSTFGCVMQAIGISSFYNIWYDKFATKRMLIAAVGKLAARYLGYVGAAVAVYDFIDCMWG